MMLANLRRQRPVIWTSLVALGSVYLIFLLTWATEDLHGVPVASNTVSKGMRAVQDVWSADPCAGWDWTAPAAQDPPACLRARQYREFQAYHASGAGAKLSNHNRKALLAAERCVLRLTSCPEPPIIIIDYKFFMWANRDMKGPGEVVWGWTIIDAMVANGFTPIFFDGARTPGWLQSWALARALPSSVHMYWTDAVSAIRCLINPACVRAEDLREHHNATLRLPRVKGEEGVLPAWRVFAPNFWGSRPDKWQGEYQMPCGDWGQCGETEWSYHVLGNQWVITPYHYPNEHTAIPMSVEQACRALLPVPSSERNDTVLILAKKAGYFGQPYFKPMIDAFGDIAAAMDELGMEMCTSAESRDDKDNGVDKTGKSYIPESVVKVGRQEPARYREILSASRVLLGIGQPPISPTPYEALCRGVPVVLPYHKSLDVTGWEAFSTKVFQHAPVMRLGEPYAYSYNSSDPADLIAKLKKAATTPIPPHVPEEMTTAAVHARVHDILFRDWEKEYDRIKRANGGQTPQYPDVIYERCFFGPKNACVGETYLL